ncbi:MAG: aminotransferase class III-fold pyridoxal phosphate-dependent enzyme [Candidatus Margulisbacteria bacterium]|nr:aminotransferase class III-fold pyridoxal phosphate-dependent enzyme [Candidatus Margulisiibacteriota bacterium]MBU1728507.1 aminotransferase class III-fold pyridoxal phosphate-dependent enzyme [Candidatus Margulisiibacteriota bacterium]MBU1954654.1 aminotransferase class III-fold pyridoxal phosphate-dependent enzyme [Candidatus Margulisiibacteriota bacterium]
MTLKERADKVLSPVLGHYFSDFEVDRGKGAYLYGTNGKKYLDFATGIACLPVGHCHPKVVKAAVAQTKKLIHVCAGIAYYEANIALAEKLQAITPAGLDMVFFNQSGSEAVETSLKLAKYTTKKPGIICFKGGFHGRTFGALSITTSKEKYRENYGPFMPEVYIADKNLESVKKIISETGADKIAAAIIEPIQGEGGYLINDPEFMTGLAKLCKENGILLIADEVQSGFGRTGKWFGFENYDIVPDIMAMAKGIGSGFPLGAVIAREDLMKAWSTGAHGGTMTGNPVTCAAALANIQVMEEEKVLDNANALGAYALKKLKKLQKKNLKIKDVRGLGLMLAVEFETGEEVKAIRLKALDEGLVLISCGPQDNIIRIVPALNIKKSQLNQGLKILEKVL